MVRISNERGRIQKCRRRIVDARIWEAIEEDPKRVTAAERITWAVNLLTGGQMAKAQVLHRVDGAGRQHMPERAARAIRQYHEWAKRAAREGIVVYDILQILVHGEGLAAQDRRNRRRYGLARANLLDGLDAYSNA